MSEDPKSGSVPPPTPKETDRGAGGEVTPRLGSVEELAQTVVFEPPGSLDEERPGLVGSSGDSSAASRTSSAASGDSAAPAPPPPSDAGEDDWSSPQFDPRQHLEPVGGEPSLAPSASDFSGTADSSLLLRRQRRAALLQEALPVTGGPPWKKIAIIALIVTLVGALMAVLTIVLTVQHFSRNLPDVHELEKGYAPPQVTRVLARDGTLLANVFSERRTVVPFERVPDHVKSAFLAAEDAGFFEHEGLDYFGLLRAMVANLRAGHVKQGGSTITQQVVKNVLLDHERSYRRKIRETILAYQLEKTLSKEQILGMYMNHIYLGHGRYGVEEAGRYYFGKHVEELDVAEATLLAGIVAAPERYSPRKDEKKALARRRYVLYQMLNKGFMTQAAHDANLEAPIRLAPAVESESDIAPEMVARAQRLLRDVAGEGARSGGYTITTTIDPALQVAARKALRDGLDDYMKRQKLAAPFTLKDRRLWGKAYVGTPRRYGIYVGHVIERDDARGEIRVQVGDVVGILDLKTEERFNPTHAKPTDFVGPGAALRVQVIDNPAAATPEEPVRLKLELGPQAALVALDPKTREVLASVGSYEALPGGLDRSVQSKRQPGSTFKPIVYSYALNTHQITAATRFTVKRTPEERKKFEQERAAKQEEEGAAPPGAAAVHESDQADTFSLSLREGISKSDNRVARQVFRDVGGQQAVQWAQTMGITSKLGPDESLMLGSYEVTVTEMVGAFSVFASGGTALAPLFIRSIESGSGELTLPPRAPERRVMDPAVAYLMTNLLESVVQEGTGKRAASLGRPLAGKTGTTNQAKDAWFIGYSTDLVVAVWVGFDDALPLGWGEAGATSALPIWTQFIKDAHKGKPPTQFPRPASIQEALIDPQTGLLARFGQKDAETEIFLPGSQPQETAPDPSEVREDDSPPPQDLSQDDDSGQDAEEGPDGDAEGGEPPPPGEPEESPPPPF